MIADELKRLQYLQDKINAANAYLDKFRGLSTELKHSKHSSETYAGLIGEAEILLKPCRIGCGCVFHDARNALTIFYRMRHDMYWPDLKKLDRDYEAVRKELAEWVEKRRIKDEILRN